MIQNPAELRIALPSSVTYIIRTLQANGFEAYAVGGCVRDTLLDRIPDDWDITTSAHPEEVMRLFRRTVETGIAHGTVTVLCDEDSHEVTTYRIDGAYSDGRHPDQVSFTSSLAEDLLRRDFTINAMAYNEEEGLVDLYGGLTDLRERRIRCVGDPADRFSEDALRILRAIRFSAQLGFSIEPATLAALTALVPRLAGISAERICTELLKLLGSDHPDYLRTAWETGITAVILPEFDRCMETEQNNPHHIFSVGEHILASVEAIPLSVPDFWPEADAGRLHELSAQIKMRYDCKTFLRLTMLLHDIAKPLCLTTDDAGTDHFKGHGPLGAELAGQIMRRLKLDNDTISKSVVLIRYHDWRVLPEEKLVRRAISKISPELFPLLLEVQIADTKAQSLFGRKEKMERILEVFHLYEQIISEQQCIRISDLAISGKDLLNLGVAEGPLIGKYLNLALESVLDDQSHNDRTYLLDMIRKQAEADRLTH